MIKSKRKPNLIEIDRGKKIYNSIFQNFLKDNNIKHYSRKSSLSAVFAGRLKLTITNLPKRPVFERDDANWIDVLPITTRHKNNRIQSSTKLNSIQASLRKNEIFVDQNSLDKRKKIKPKFQVKDIVRTADLKDKRFSKSDTTNWSYRLYNITELINNTIPIYHIDNLSKRYNETLLKKTELTIENIQT